MRGMDLGRGAVAMRGTCLRRDTYGRDAGHGPFDRARTAFGGSRGGAAGLAAASYRSTSTTTLSGCVP